MIHMYPAGITDSWLTTVTNKVKASPSGSFLAKDNRGRHYNRPHRIPETISKYVYEHINMFPRVEGHYCRSNTQRQFLQPGLNLKIMYKLYLEFIEDKQVQPVSEYYYRKKFKKCKLIIEKKSRGQNIFTQDQWYEIIKNAVKKKPYEVKELNVYDIFNFSLVAEKRKWKNLHQTKF